jgi:diphthamide biosynthesis protein 2
MILDNNSLRLKFFLTAIGNPHFIVPDAPKSDFFSQANQFFYLDETVMETSSTSFDLERLVEIVSENKFKRVALQFVDDYIHLSVEIYLFLLSVFQESVDFYIVADSTWGTSIDDISANHVTADLLVYFGSDLSSSSTIPVLILSESKLVDFQQFTRTVKNLVAQDESVDESVIVFYEPSYYWLVAKLFFYCNRKNIIVADLPPQANLSNWSPSTTGNTSVLINSRISIGGLLIPSDALTTARIGKILYIGNKTEQMENILLRITNSPFHHYNPELDDMQVYQGDQRKQLMERYGGIEKVRKAKIVGLLVGSMGYDALLTNQIIVRLEKLIKQAGKYFYTFVMGRINEAKLCNFPEVSLLNGLFLL